MKILVVGGAGFIGSHLCDALLDQGNNIICVDNFSLGTEKNIEHVQRNEHFKLHVLNAADEQMLAQVFEEEKIEYVFHLAANSDIQASAKSPKIEYENTYTTTFNVLSCMKEFGVKRLFFASTSAVYGNKPGVMLDENTPDMRPVSYYGAAKLGSEAIISAFTYMNDMSSLIFRFPNVIGPRLTHGVIFDFIRKLRNNPEELEILGDGRQTKPYIYVSDLVDAIIRFMDVEEGITLYNIGVEGDTSVTRIADILCEEMKLTDVKYLYTGGTGGWKGDVPKFSYCLNKIHRMGWSAKYSSDEAVRKTIRQVLKEGEQ